MNDVCCGSDEPTVTAPVEGDACCGPEEASSPPPLSVWWRDVSLLPSALAGVLLLIGLMMGWVGADVPALVALWLSLAAGAWTFVPGALRRLRRGRLGVVRPS